MNCEVTARPDRRGMQTRVHPRGTCSGWFVGKLSDAVIYTTLAQ